MKIRLMTKDAPLFDHAGLVLRPQWSEHDTDEMGEEARLAVEKYHGQIVMVHPHDAEALDEIKAKNAAARAKASAKPAMAPSSTAKGGKA